MFYTCSLILCRNLGVIDINWCPCPRCSIHTPVNVAVVRPIVNDWTNSIQDLDFVTDVASATPELSHNEPVDNGFEQDDAENDVVDLVLISDDESNSNTSEKIQSLQVVELVTLSDSDSHEAGNSENRSPREVERIVLAPLSQPQKTKKKKKNRKRTQHPRLVKSLEICWLKKTLRGANFSPVWFNLKFTGQFFGYWILSYPRVT